MTRRIDERPARLLIVAPYCVTPPDTGGKIRVWELASGAAARGISVTIAMPVTPAQWFRRKVKDNLTLDVVPYPFLAPLLLSDRPFSYIYLISLHPGYALLMRRLIESHDIIQFEGACFGDLVNAIGPEKAVVYDAHNVEYDYARSESRRPWVRRISSKRIRALEKGIVQRADHTLTCSDSDAHRLQELYDVGGNKFTTAPNGIHLDRRTQRMTESEAAERHPGLLDHPVRAIFSGSDVKHNRAAVQFLLDSVAPRLRGDCAFVFKGQCARQFTGCQLDNVFYDLTPGNVGTYADVCTVALNPVTQGSGTSLKVLDYLAHGFPLISTEFGMRGFEDLMNLVALVEPKGFVDALRNQPRLATEIRGALEKYSWAYVAETACNVYRSLQPSDSVSSEVQV